MKHYTVRFDTKCWGNKFFSEFCINVTAQCKCEAISEALYIFNSNVLGLNIVENSFKITEKQ
jgi:hypothetical protein